MLGGGPREGVSVAAADRPKENEQVSVSFGDNGT
jgi:hypothetical protein